MRDKLSTCGATAGKIAGRIYKELQDFALQYDVSVMIPCSKISCHFNTGKEQNCTRKPDNVTPNTYDCAFYRDVFIIPSFGQPIGSTSLISVNINKNRENIRNFSLGKES